MKARISVTELSRELRSILDRVHRQRDSFVIEDDGKAVAALEPMAGMATWSTLAKELQDVPRTDTAFGAHLEEIQRHQPDIPTDVWPS